MMKFIAALLFLVAVVQAASLLHADSPTIIPGSYIVVLKDGSGVARRDAHIEKLKAVISATNDSSAITHRYKIGSFVGFAATLSTELLNIELADSDVEYIEADQVVRINGVVTQPDSTWGLARISRRGNVSSVPYDYTYDTQGGLGVNVYVLDTGILATHVEFQHQSKSRVVAGYNAITSEPNTDLNGHGTHCAGTVGGTTYGVAKNVTLISVKVLNGGGSGSWSGVVSGINNVTDEYLLNRIPSVASLSLGGGPSTSVDTAVRNSVAAGVAYSIAAGNSNLNACNYSPARVSETSAAITVGAIIFNGTKASYSNIGKCVSLFAPGSNVTSAWIGSNTATLAISGTSMATPHVAGVLALKLGQNSTSTPAYLKDWINAQATKGAVFSPGFGSPNLLLFSPAPVEVDAS